MSKEKLIDLDREQLDLLHAILKRHIPNKTVWAYGSRATWKAKETSDLDLAVFDCAPMEIYHLKEELEESDLLVSVDVMDWESIPESFRENIGEKYVVVQEKAMRPEGWREVRLGDVAEINPKETIPKGAKAPKVLMDFLVPHTKRIPEYIVENYKGGSKFKNGDTLVARITPCLENGKTSFVDFLENDQVGFGSTEFIVLREKQGVTDRHYLYYLAVSDDFRDIAVKSMTGTSGRQRVVTDEILRYKFFLPELPEQKAIVEVLSSLDDKIDLLHRQNKTLEDMAQALFREWFVHGRNDTWEQGKLGEVFTVKGGTTPSTKEKNYWNGDINWTTPRDLSGHNAIFLLDTEKRITEQGLAKISSGLLPAGTVLLSSRAPVGYLAITDIDLAINQGYIAIVCNKILSNYFVYLWGKHHIKIIKKSSGGTVFQEIPKSVFRQIDIAIPPEKVLSSFDQLIKPIFQKVKYNQYQIRKLENLRDTLLPKLMNGSVQVKVDGLITRVK
ncbi:MAG: restriction endonuclease subunit S [Gammaproteobacteria bacterium]|nr:restriction endonuclease subunit S [Gammaproteobacteria bacterium]